MKHTLLILLGMFSISSNLPVGDGIPQIAVALREKLAEGSHSWMEKSCNFVQEWTDCRGLKEFIALHLPDRYTE